MKNLEIRKASKTRGVKLWEVAEVLGIADSAFSRKLRHELSDAERERVMEAITRAAELKQEASA